MIQSHLKKLFAGIHTVQFNSDETEIIAMKSLEGEVVPLVASVPISSDVEVFVVCIPDSFLFSEPTCTRVYNSCTLPSL